MSTNQIRLGYKPSSLELPYSFIDNYLTGCAPVYPLIYIFSLRHLVEGNPITIPGISQHFGLLETDVINAWRHFENVGLVQVEGSGTDISITFLPVEKPLSSPKKTSPSQAILPMGETIGESAAPAPATPTITKEPIAANEPTNPTKPWRQSPPPQYSAEELEIYSSQSKDIARLFSKTEQALGRYLKPTDLSTIFSFYDWLRLPLDVIEYLLCYCEEHGHRNLRYIEKCALDWADQGIDDLEKALTYVQTFDKEYRSILKHMGKLTTFPTPAQRKLMDKWLHEMQLPLDVVLAACDRTTLVAEKPSLSYVDTILKKWHKAGIITLEAVQQADTDFAKEKDMEKEKAIPKEDKQKKTKNNRFINFDQRENDYTQIEKMERQYLLKRLKG
ncbi:MAG: DnaD domain protein [Defluviitaleaceae bacterium]|nr:DnaD domain protein [Defluviitaleaceae bacterium]